MNREDDSENGVAFVPIGRKNRVTFDQEPTEDDNNEIEEEEYVFALFTHHINGVN